MIFSNFVLHWIKNIEDKKKVFQNMFRSLKPTGKIFMRYSGRLPTHFDCVFRVLNPENMDRLLNLFEHETRPVIEKLCEANGFRILKSFDEKHDDLAFEMAKLCVCFSGRLQTVYSIHSWLLKNDLKSFALGFQVEKLAELSCVGKRPIYAVF